MGTVRALPMSAARVRLADAVTVFLATIVVDDTRRSYAAALNWLVRDFGADTDVALLDPVGLVRVRVGRHVAEDVQPAVYRVGVGVRLVAQTGLARW
jgi:hypothetical protein